MTSIVNRALAQWRSAPSGRRSRRRGMSLVEVMVVIAIILTLMSVLAIGVWGIFGESQVDTTRLTMSKVSERIEIYQLRKKHPPSSADGLAVVFGNEKVPQDAWGHDFIYVTPGPGGRPYDLNSLGADGKEGGTGTDEDLHWVDER